MAKFNLPQGQISFTPDNELIILYPKDTLKKRVFANLRYIILVLFILIMVSGLIATYFDIDAGFMALFILPILFLINSSTLKKATIEQVTLTATGLKYKYFNYKTPEIIELEDSSYVDIKVKLLDDSTIELDIDDFLIYFDDIEKLPLVIDNIATTWNMEYYDTIHVNENQEILTYSSKSISNFKANSRLKFEDKPRSITFRDDLAIQKYFSIDKQMGELYSYKLKKGFFRLNPSLHSIQIVAFSNLGVFSKESEIRVNLIYKNDRLNTIFISERRHKDEIVTTYRDVELIYDKLKELPGLENVKIEKQFK